MLVLCKSGSTVFVKYHICCCHAFYLYHDCLNVSLRLIILKINIAGELPGYSQAYFTYSPTFRLLFTYLSGSSALWNYHVVMHPNHALPCLACGVLQLQGSPMGVEIIFIFHFIIFHVSLRR